MKRIASLLLFSIFLASCANVVTPTLVVTETSARTATAVFTPTPTKTPTATPEPTNTPDPLAGAPEGATGKDSKGNYIKTVTDAETGKTTTFDWTEVKSPTGEVLYKDWTILKTPDGGIPLLDWPPTDLEAYRRDIGHILLYVSDKVLGTENLPNFIHKDKTMEQLHNSDVTSRARVALFYRINGRNPKGDDLGDFEFKLQKGEMPFDFYIDTSEKGVAIWVGFCQNFKGKSAKKPTRLATPSENTLFWNPSPDHGVKVFFTDWDSLEGSPEFYLRKVLFRSKILGVDKDGNLIGLIASKASIDTLREVQYWQVILFHAASVIDRADQTTQSSNETLESFIAFADNQNPETWIVQVPSK